MGFFFQHATAIGKDLPTVLFIYLFVFCMIILLKGYLILQVQCYIILPLI